MIPEFPIEIETADHDNGKIRLTMTQDNWEKLLKVLEEHNGPTCEVNGCLHLAEWEGWYRCLDIAGLPSGLIQRRCVCEEHKKRLIGGQT